MRRKMWRLLCSMFIGLFLTAGVVYGYQEGFWEAEEEVQQMQEEYAWWSLTYDRPNPEQLPVRVHFQWLKGLE